MKTPLFLFLAVALFFGCKKDDANPELDKLPPETQTGANTFGCLVNGTAWICDSVSLFKALTTVIVRGQGKDGSSITITLRGNELNQNETYSLTWISWAQYSNQCTYHSSDGTGTVTIDKLDETNRIISARFSFSASNDTCALKKISITDGRFDCKYLP